MYIQTLIPHAYDPAWTPFDGIVLNNAPQAIKGTPSISNPNAVATTTVPINQGTSAAKAVLTQNPRRKLLIVQNNSTATSPDVAPIFYIGFGGPAQVGIGLGLPPGVGIVLDVSCPTDAVYVTFGPSSGPSVVIQGAAVEGGQPS